MLSCARLQFFRFHSLTLSRVFGLTVMWTVFGFVNFLGYCHMQRLLQVHALRQVGASELGVGQGIVWGSSSSVS